MIDINYNIYVFCMIVGLLPSRLNSKRLKEKPLIIIDKLPLIVHTFKRAMLAKELDEVIVCTDHKKIIDVVRKHGGKSILTSKKHKNGTERIYEVAKKKNAELFIDIQGDEPLIHPGAIDKVIKFHRKNKHFDIVVPSIPALDDASSKNTVKMIFNDNGKVIYFSRAKSPYDYKKKRIKYYKDCSIVSFQPRALKKYCQLKMGKLEKIEDIELLRAIENNMNVGTFILKASSFSVNIAQDLMKAMTRLPKDSFRRLY